MDEHQNIVIDAHTFLRPRSLVNEKTVYEFIDKQRDYLSQWVRWTADYTPEQLHRDIVEVLQDTKDGTFFLFDIFYKGEFAGAVNAQDVITGQSAEIGYYIGEQYAGKGLATKAAQKMIDFLIHHSNIHHFTLEITEGNDASVRVAEKLGFTYVSQSQNERNHAELKYEKHI